MYFIDSVADKTCSAPGTGAVTLSGTAPDGYRTAVGLIPNSSAGCIRIELESNAATWEDCESVYTTSGTSASRGTLQASSTGSRVNFTGAVTVRWVVPAEQFTLVPVVNGGTGAATLTNHGVVLGQGTSAMAATSAGTANQVLTSNGASADPTFQDPSMVTLGSSAGGSSINDTTLTAQQLGGTITIAANTLQQGDSLLVEIVASETTSPTTTAPTMTVAMQIDGTNFTNIAARWSSINVSQTALIWKEAIALEVVIPSGNNFTLNGWATSGTTGSAAPFPGGMQSQARTTLPLTAASTNGSLTGVDKTATHTFAFFITFNSTHGLIVAPEMVRVLRIR